MAGKKKSYKGKKQYAAYKNEDRAAKNRAARLKRHLRKHPNDAQTAKSAKRPGVYKNKPMVKGHYPDAKVYTLDAAGHKEIMPDFKPNWM